MRYMGVIGLHWSGASTCRTLPSGHATKPKDPVHWADKYILAACAGAIGGLSVLFGSTCSRSLASEHLSAFADPFFYCYLIMMLVCVITQTSLLNQAMQLGDMMSVFHGVFLEFVCRTLYTGCVLAVCICSMSYIDCILTTMLMSI